MTTIKELTVSKSDLVRVKPENINIKAGELDELKDAAEQTEGKVTRQKLDGVERAKRGSKSSVKAIMEQALATADEGDDETVRITLTLEAYEELCRLLNV